MVSTSSPAAQQRMPWPQVAATLAAGLVLGNLAWIDPLFLPLVLIAPPVSGFLTARRGWQRRWVVAAWIVAGLVMLVSDWVVNSEDQGFHLAVAFVDGALAAAGWQLGRWRRRG